MPIVLPTAVSHPLAPCTLPAASVIVEREIYNNKYYTVVVNCEKCLLMHRPAKFIMHLSANKIAEILLIIHCSLGQHATKPAPSTRPQKIDLLPFTIWY